MQSVEGFRLSPQQRRLWQLQADGGAAYQAQGIVIIDGPLHPALLASALQQVVDQHEILRTSFHLLPSTALPVQVIAEQTAPVCHSYDLANLPSEAQQSQLVQLLAQLAAEHRDLQQSSLLRSALVALGPQKHALLLSLPALCADTATIENLIRAIGAAYAAQQTGAALDDEITQYADVAELFNELLESEDMASARLYWRRQDLSALAFLALPFEDRASQPVFASQRHALTVPTEIVAGIVACAERYGTTVESWLLACWQVLLARLSGESQLVVGSGQAGRTYEGLDTALGLFARYVPVAARLSEDASFASVVQQIDRSLQEVSELQDYFSWDLIGGKQADAPFFAFGFDATRYPAALRIADLAFSIADQHASIDRFKLRLACVVRDQALDLALHYDPALYAGPEIERLAERFQTLLAVVTAAPESVVSAASIVGPQERQLLVATLNATTSAEPQDRCIHQLFEAQAARTLDATAVVYADQQISYAELNARANQVAGHLRSLGVRPETPVGLYLPRSIEMIVGLLAILKAGGAYVPFDPAYPAERLSFMLQDSQAQVLITQQSHAEVVAALQPVPAVVWIDTDWPQIAGHSADNLAAQTSPQNMAYVIYTSGSTGTPKGVVVQHRSVANLAAGLDQAIYADSAETALRISMNGPLVFDTSVKQWVQLLRGHTLVIIPEEQRLDLDGLADYLNTHQIDVLDCTPSLLKPLLKSPRLGQYPRQILVGGEAIDEGLWQTLATENERRSYNLYGPTETTVDATISRIDGDASTIGRPIPNAQVYILDASLRPVPLGLSGELCIGGAGLARGYLNRPDLTAERFIPDPFGGDRGVPGARLYRTGDLARYRANGSIEYLGRIDQQVKLRGYRVELGEIEATLSQHPAVEDAAVIVCSDLPDQQRLVAYVVPDGQSAFTVRRQLQMEREGRLSQRSCYELPNGLLVDQVNKNETEFLYDEIFEQQTYLRHGISLHDGACVFDVGANIGMFSLFVGERCPGATVYAFEPIPPVFEVLRTNSQLYPFDIVPIQAGLSDQPGEVVFTSYAHASTMSGRYVDADEERQVIRSLVLTQEQAAHPGAALDETLLDEMIAERLTSTRFTCPLTTVSEMIRRHKLERIDLLKIDAQKSELDVLNGIQPEDWPKIGHLVLEVHDIEGRVGHVQSLLERHGYQVVVEQETAMAGTPLYAVYARRPVAQPSADATIRRETWSSQSRLTGDLRRFLSERLPEYMLPAAFVLLESLPLTPNGKLNRRGLPAPDRSRPGLEQTFVAPRTATETLLSRIWSEILRQEAIGIHHNFFELGGDSILGIQVIARANQAGLKLNPRQLFQHQTIAELAAVADDGAAQTVEQEQESAGGSLPLLPVQRWFFEQEWPDLGAWNQIIRLELRQPIAPAQLEQVIAHLLHQHDALRLRFVQRDDGWQQEIVEPTDVIPFTTIDLSALAEAEQDSAVEQVAADLANRLDLASGTLLHAIRIDRGEGRPPLLLLATHALAVDGFSRRILAEDLQSACMQLSSGAALEPLARTTSLKRWAETLAGYAHSDRLRQELDYWLGLIPGDSPCLPLDVPHTETSAEPETVVVSLDGETTRALLNDVPAAYRTEINDALLTALVQAFKQWTGHSSLLLDLRGHGREPLFDGIDLSRTVGWFTSIFPVRLDLGAADQPGPALLAIKEQLRQIPHHGVGYGVLRYLGDESVAERLRALPAPEVSFNYLGQFDQVLPDSAFALTQDQIDPANGLWSPRYGIEIQGGVVGGELRLAWKYDPQRYQRATIERLAQLFVAALRELIAHCQAPDAGGYTPSDFPLVNVNQQTLDAILAQVRKAQG